MNPEDQKSAAVRFLEACDGNDRATIDALLSPNFICELMEVDGDWSVDGRTLSNKLDRQTFLDFAVPAVRQLTRDGMHFAYELMMSDGPHVVILGSSNAMSYKDRPYTNVYSWYFRFEGDKIALHREYRDTQHSRTAIFD